LRAAVLVSGRLAESPGRLRRASIIAFFMPSGYEGGENHGAGRRATMTIRYLRATCPTCSITMASGSPSTPDARPRPHRDRLCVVSSPGDGSADIVRSPPPGAEAPNLVALLYVNRRFKIFNYARFDVAFIFKTFGVMTTRVYCTKIASKLIRTYTDRHGLRDLVKDLLDIDLNKQQQSSDWAAETLSDAQLAYAASDVLYLHALRSLDRRRLRGAPGRACRRLLRSCRRVRSSTCRLGRGRHLAH
jgi:ribonuclease D